MRIFCVSFVFISAGFCIIFNVFHPLAGTTKVGPTTLSACSLYWNKDFYMFNPFYIAKNQSHLKALLWLCRYVHSRLYTGSRFAWHLENCCNLVFCIQLPIIGSVPQQLGLLKQLIWCGIGRWEDSYHVLQSCFILTPFIRMTSWIVIKSVTFPGNEIWVTMIYWCGNCTLVHIDRFDITKWYHENVEEIHLSVPSFASISSDIVMESGVDQKLWCLWKHIGLQSDMSNELEIGKDSIST